MAVADSVGAFLEFLPVGKKARPLLVPSTALQKHLLAMQGSRFNPKTLQAGNAGNWEGSGVSSE